MNLSEKARRTIKMNEARINELQVLKNISISKKDKEMELFFNKQIKALEGGIARWKPFIWDF